MKRILIVALSMVAVGAFATADLSFKTPKQPQHALGEVTQKGNTPNQFVAAPTDTSDVTKDDICKRDDSPRPIGVPEQSITKR